MSPVVVDKCYNVITHYVISSFWWYQYFSFQNIRLKISIQRLVLWKIMMSQSDHIERIITSSRRRKMVYRSFFVGLSHGVWIVVSNDKQLTFSLHTFYSHTHTHTYTYTSSNGKKGEIDCLTLSLSLLYTHAHALTLHLYFWQTHTHTHTNRQGEKDWECCVVQLGYFWRVT